MGAPQDVLSRPLSLADPGSITVPFTPLKSLGLWKPPTDQPLPFLSSLLPASISNPLGKKSFEESLTVELCGTAGEPGVQVVGSPAGSSHGLGRRASPQELTTAS